MINKIVHTIAFLLVIVGALNWGLVGAAEINLVTKLFGTLPAIAGFSIERLVYILVGLSGVWLAISHSSECKNCQ